MRLVVAALFGTTLLACGSSQAGFTEQPSSLVAKAIANFRAASLVTVVPDADGEATCDMFFRPCAPFNLTQTSTTQSGGNCNSIPSCAAVFFTPIPKLFITRQQWSGSVFIIGDSRPCDGWCSWEMWIDRATQEIIKVDIYVAGGSHTGWPTYSFQNYVVGGENLDPPHSQAPLATGTLSLRLSGGASLDYRSTHAHCLTRPAGEEFSLTDGAALRATTPYLWTFDLLFEDAASDQSWLTVSLIPGHAYNGQITTRAVNGDPWHRTMSGSMPSDDPKHPDSVNLTAEINCG